MSWVDYALIVVLAAVMLLAGVVGTMEADRIAQERYHACVEAGGLDCPP